MYCVHYKMIYQKPPNLFTDDWKQMDVSCLRLKRRCILSAHVNWQCVLSNHILSIINQQHINIPRCPLALNHTYSYEHIQSCQNHPTTSSWLVLNWQLPKHSRVGGFPDAPQALAATAQGSLGQQELHEPEHTAVSALQRHLFFRHLHITAGTVRGSRRWNFDWG